MKLIEPPMAHDFGEPPAPPDESGQFDTARMLRTVQHGMPIIVAALVCGVALGGAALRVLPARYTSAAQILIDPKRPGAYGADGEFTNTFVDASKVADVEVILASTGLLRRVVAAEHLADDPRFGDAPPSLTQKWLSILPIAHTPPAPNTRQDREARAIATLGRMIRTQRIGVTYVIEVDVTAPTAPLAQRIARAVADAYLADQRASKLVAVDHDAEWLKTRLDQQHTALVQSEAVVEAIRQKYGLLSADQGSGPDTTVDRQSVTAINEELIRAQGDVADSGARYRQAQDILAHGGDLGGLTDVATSKLIEDLRKEKGEADSRMADMSLRYAANYPGMREAQASRDALGRQLSAEIGRVVESLRNNYETALAHAAALKQQLAAVTRDLNATANAEGREKLSEAQRVVVTNNNAYETTKKALDDVEQQQSRQEVEARIISDPELSDAPSFPKPPLCLAAGGALGLMIGVGLAFLFPYHRNRVVDVASAERASSLTVLAMTPFLSPTDLQSGGRILPIPEYLAVKPFSRFAESLRLLRLRLRAPGANGAQVIQVTSAVPGEGKSTLAAGLAISAASAGIRTVILDLDLHNPSVGKLFGGEPSQGVVNVLQGTATAGTALRSHGNLPLRIIDAGLGGRPRPDMFEGAQLRELIRELSKICDLIVLDTPPVLAISDPLFISGLVDSTIMVVAWQATPQRSVDDALAALRSARAPLAGLVLNKVKLARAGKYGIRSYAYEGYGVS
jgi:capsular exopolysaccharide synthesis family protein